MRLSTRLGIAFAAIVVVITGFASPASATQDVPFSIHKGPAADGNKWHAEATGNVTFYSSRRKFDVIGVGVYHHSPTNDGVGYMEVQQNLKATPTASDPAYRTVTEGACTSDTSIPLITWTCDVGSSYLNPTTAGHGLAGVRLRICVRQPGTDPCGPVQYRDNPFL